MLEIRGLTRPGLGPVDLDLAAGECVAVMGPSGSGKTLLLRALADLDPTEGSVRLDGAPRESLPAPEWRSRVMYLASDSGWWAEGVGAHFEAPEAAARIAVRLGLPSACLGWPVSRLSTGERQRLALARVLVRSPRVMLLDEPTSGLDAAAAAKVEAMLRERLAAGAAILVTTHDPSQAARLASRRLEARTGRFEEVGA